MSPSYGMITEPLSDLSLGTRHLGHSSSLLKIKIYSLRVVQTQAILFLKSMSERGGSDIQRLLNHEFLDRLKID